MYKVKTQHFSRLGVQNYTTTDHLSQNNLLVSVDFDFFFF